MRKGLKSLLISTIIGAMFFFASAFVACNADLNNFENYENADKYSVGNVEYTASQITRVEITWVSGEIELVHGIGETLSVTEETPASKEEERLHYYLFGDTLQLKFCASGYRGIIDESCKKLRVELPENIELEIESVAADIYAETLTLSGLEIETVSGKVQIDECNAPLMDLETVSGDVEIGLPKKTVIVCDTVSGNFSISLFSGLGAKVELDTLSGKMQTEKEYSKIGKHYDIFGADGVSTDCLIKVESVSGNVFVK